MALIMDVARIKIITSHAIKTGTLIVNINMYRTQQVRDPFYSFLWIFLESCENSMAFLLKNVSALDT
jgi:hypothetical protein